MEKFQTHLIIRSCLKFGGIDGSVVVSRSGLPLPAVHIALVPARVAALAPPAVTVITTVTTAAAATATASAAANIRVEHLKGHW